MATKSGELDLTGMYSTHDAFLRDLTQLKAAASAGRAGSPKVREGWENFKTQLVIHHTIEDAALWPPLRNALADRPDDLAHVDDMEAEHALLDPLLDAVDAAMAGSGEDLTEKVQELAEALGDHMKHEEEVVIPLIRQALPEKDWVAFRSAMARRQGPKGAAVYVPWVLDGTSDAYRRQILGEMPYFIHVLNRVLWERRYHKRRLWAA